jgi:ABC-2 type transport system permease protein
MGPVLAVAAKELRMLFRDRPVVAFLFLLPTVFVFVMTMALQGAFEKSSGETLRILVVDEDRGALGEGLRGTLGKLEWMDAAVPAGPDRGSAVAHRAVENGEAAAAVHLPEGATDALLRASLGARAVPGPVVEVEIVAEPALTSQVKAALRGAVLTAVRRAQIEVVLPKMADALAALAPPEAAPRIARGVREKLGTQEDLVAVRTVPPKGLGLRTLPNSAQQNVPGYTVFGIYLIAMLLSAGIARERQTGTYRRTLVSPVSGHALLLGKVLPLLGVNILQAVLMFGVGVLLIPLVGGPPFSLGGALPGLIIVTLCISLSAIGLGLFAASLRLSPDSTLLLTAIALIIMAALAGLMVPSFIMPRAMVLVGAATPQSWALRGYQDLLVRGRSLVEVLPSCGVLLGFAAVFYLIGFLRTRTAS